MKVVCINNNRYIDILTFGKIYKVLCSNINPSYILIKNDDDKLCTISRKLFIPYIKIYKKLVVFISYFNHTYLILFKRIPNRGMSISVNSVVRPPIFLLKFEILLS